MVCHAGRTDLEKTTAVLSGPFLEPPGAAPLDRLTKKGREEKKRKNECLLL